MILFGQRSSDQLCQTQYLGFIQQIIKTSTLLKFFENLVKKNDVRWHETYKQKALICSQLKYK